MTISVPDLPAALAFDGVKDSARWQGHLVTDEARFRSFLAGPVSARATDAVVEDDFEDELQALATTGMGTAFLKEFLEAVPEEKSWEVGEALAETVLAEDSGREVVWPWNESRDRKTPQASLPGADLVGFCRDGSGVALLFGEVKTSTDARTPPGVMVGRSGLTWQLEANATRLDIQHCLLRWLRLRCQTVDLVEMYKEAVGRYLNSSGQDLLIVGVLLRDRAPDERDLRSRAEYLAGCLSAATRVELIAWYLPLPIAEWPALLEGAA